MNIEETVRKRGEEYGHPVVNHGRTARLWNAYLRNRSGAEPLDPMDVCCMMVLLKLSRIQEGVPSQDTIMDVAGYAVNMKMLLEAKSSRPDA